MFELLEAILELSLVFGLIWQLNKTSKENKQLHQNVELLQQQLIEALNKDVKNQDKFSTDPVE